MAFFNKIARAFGFGNDTDPEYDEVLKDTTTESAMTQPAATAGPTSAAVQVLDIDAEHVNLIFGKVVEVFNQALPDFLAQSVDCEKERQFLYDALDLSLKQYLTDVRRSAHQKCQADWAAEREKLQADADELRKHAAELEEKRSQLKDRQLSADRQKRALQERVKDLEDQVMRLEAEKEQLDIENKCMLNKAKAAAVLEAQLEDIQLSQTRSDMNDAMLSDFKKQAAEATKALKDYQEAHKDDEEKMRLQEAQMDDLKKAIQVKEAQLEEAQMRLTEAEERAANLQSALHEKEEALQDCVSVEELSAIQAQVEQFEDVRAKMDARIEKLRESLRKAQDENKDLRDTIKFHIEEKARLEQTINALNQTSDPQKTETNEIESDAKKKMTRKMKSPASIDDVDDIISGADWLVSVPDEESPMRTQDPPSQFGYQAPQRKRQVENEAQRSLFDL